MLDKMDTYICQFCGEESPEAEWNRDECPKCGKTYDWMLAQDIEE